MTWQLKEKPHANVYTWHECFLFFPTRMEGTNTVVWLEIVERKLEAFASGYDYVYRRINAGM